MIYHISAMLEDVFDAFNVVHYLTFRVLVAMLTAMSINFLLTPWFIRLVTRKHLGQVVRDDGPQKHLEKTGTPTMGGCLIALSVIFSSILWTNLNNHYFWMLLVIFVGFALLGFADDYLKISKKNSKGVSARAKLVVQFAIATVVCVYHVYFAAGSTTIHLPFLKNVQLEFGLWYIPFATIVIVGFSNAVNLTDGLDGLAIAPVMVAAGCYTILVYVAGNIVMSDYLHLPYIASAGELAIFSASLIGAGLGFLWYNTYPAQVFMGDVGSLPLGAALGALAVFSKHEILLAIIGGVFVLETVSVITQVVSFKLTGRRVFRMAPLHHHFELKGWAEPKVIVRFWIMSVTLGLFGLLTLKLR